MSAYKTFITIDGPSRVVLSDLPFRRGQRVRVVMLTAEDEATIISQHFQELFKATQALPGVEDIDEADILTEIAAHRRGK